MELLKDWTACVCITLVIATLFSLISPNGKMGNFYKILISLFVFLSFLYPIKDVHIENKAINFQSNIITESYDKTLSNMLEAEIKSVLEANNIFNSSVIVNATKNNNEIEIHSVSIAVNDDYNCEDVKEIIFQNLGINAEVHKLGD